LDFFFSFLAFLDFFFGLTLSSLESSESESDFALTSGLASSTTSLTSAFLLTRTSAGFAIMLLFSSETKYLTHD